MLLHSLSIFLAVFGTAFADCSNIRTRSMWSAQRAKGVAYLVVPLPYVTIHHTATPECLSFATCSEKVRNIQSYHMDELGWDDVGYSFFIGGDGSVYEGVGWNKEGAHTYHWNKKSAGIAFIGSFQDIEPSQKMLDAARTLIDCGKSEGYLRDSVKVLGGRQLISTISPGNKLFSRIQNWPDWASTP